MNILLRRSADRRAVEADTPKESADDHYNNDSDYRKTNIIQKKIKVKRHIFPVHKYELTVHAVNKHTIKLRYPELEVINQDKCKYAQNQHGCIFKVVAIDVFPEYQFPVPPATVSLQSYGCNTRLQHMAATHGCNLFPSVKKRLPKANSATHRERFPFLNRNETIIHLLSVIILPPKKKSSPEL